MSKKSIRFFNDREVRAVWDEEHSKWWFSATDIVRAINDEDDYTKCRNYWKYLKGKMAKEGVQLVSLTNHFKFLAPDGKQRAADALDADCVQTLAKNYPTTAHVISLTGSCIATAPSTDRARRRPTPSLRVVCLTAWNLGL